MDDKIDRTKHTEAIANDGPLMTMVEENTQLACHQIAMSNQPTAWFDSNTTSLMSAATPFPFGSLTPLPTARNARLRVARNVGTE